MEGWNRTSLGDACQFINGLWKGEVPPLVHVGVIRNTNFTKDGALDDSDIAYLDVEAKKFAKRRLQYGDLILEKSGGGPKQPVGRVVFFDKKDGDYSFSNFTAAMRVIEPNRLDPLYLHRYLHWVYVSGRTEAMQSHSTGIRNLNGDAYKAITVDYPPVPEQRRIIAILDEAFEAIATAKANTEKSLQNAGELFRNMLSTLIERQGLGQDPEAGGVMEGWESKSLSEICGFQRGLTYAKSDEVESPGHTVLRANNIDLTSHELDFNELKFISNSVAVPASKIVRPGSLLVCTASGSKSHLGKVAYIDSDYGYAFGGFMGQLTPSKGIDGRYLFYALISPGYKDFIEALSDGVNINNLKFDDLGRFPVPLPPLPEQRRIVAILDGLSKGRDRLLDLRSGKLFALDELKKSLLHQAFTGRLTAKSTEQQVSEVA